MTRDYLTVVSGLPRSGTSMMMKILEAGGVEPITDNLRKADRDNPKGYYEFEPAKNTRNDASWLVGSAGKSVKMVYRLLYDLPVEGHTYKVIFMRRELDEVLRSQGKMLKRLGRDMGQADQEAMGDLFRRDLEVFAQWAQRQDAFEFLDVKYGDRHWNVPSRQKREDCF